MGPRALYSAPWISNRCSTILGTRQTRYQCLAGDSKQAKSYGAKHSDHTNSNHITTHCSDITSNSHHHTFAHASSKRWPHDEPTTTITNNLWAPLSPGTYNT